MEDIVYLPRPNLDLLLELGRDALVEPDFVKIKRLPQAVRAATAELKQAQIKLTNLRREHLETGFVRDADVDALVAGMAAEVRSLTAEIPPMLRRALPDVISLELEDKIYDLIQAHIAAGVAKALERFKPAPAPSSKVPYTTKPGPRPGSRAGAPRTKRRANGHG